MKSVNCGVDFLLQAPELRSKTRKPRIGLLCHPSSINSKFEHSAQVLMKTGCLKALFGPQHGIYGETQDNMIEWQDQVDPRSGLPIYSLYGVQRKPSRESLSNLDLMVIDLFDVGVRIYTFIYTMSYVLEACAELKIPVLICDRPNPIGGTRIEGSSLNPSFKSFVGRFSIPLVHGMTIGEIALLFAEQMEPRPNIKVLKLKGWKRSMLFPQTKLRWTLPSPNMPQFETSVLFPGMVYLEGTSLSEGRGTTRPFELIGAPFFDWDEIEKAYRSTCKDLKIRSPIIFHRQGFIPTFHKFSGTMCRGALQICTDPSAFWSGRHGAIMLSVLRRLYGKAWDWTSPPYEYEYEKLPIDMIAGGSELRETIDQGLPLKDLFGLWKRDEAAFLKTRQKFLLYR